MTGPRSCHYCQSTTRELRPYGPEGSWVCAPCVTESPEREEQAKRAFAALVEAAGAAGGGLAILTDEGPQPYRGPR